MKYRLAWKHFIEADNSEEWLKKFFNTLINNYINGNRKSML